MIRLERAAEATRRRGKAKPQMIAITESCRVSISSDYDDNDDNVDDDDNGNNDGDKS